MTATTSDEELVALYRDSHVVSALEELVGRHVPQVRAMIFQMVVDHNTADELTQVTLCKAIKALDSFEGRSQFGTWLYRIAMNTTHSFLDMQARSPVVFQPDLSAHGSREVTPDKAALTAELLAKTDTAVASLSPKLRAAIVLTGLQGLSGREAAAIENCSESTMHWRVHEARKQLKHKLRDYLS